MVPDCLEPVDPFALAQVVEALEICFSLLHEWEVRIQI
jgi:hypothetical protein